MLTSPAETASALGRRQVAASTTPGIGVPVLAYHRVYAEGLTPAQFSEQMAILYRLGYRTITLRGLSWYLQQGIVPAGRVVLTFDDIGNPSAGGAKDMMATQFGDFWLHVFPVLRQYGYKGVLGIITQHIPDEGRGWDWKKIRFLQALGWELASHSVTHGYGMAGIGSPMSRDEFVSEFRDSRDIIATKCGHAPSSYFWPFGEVHYREEAAALYPILVSYYESVAVSRLDQLQHVPRYHAELHLGQDLQRLMEPYAAGSRAGVLNPRMRRAESVYTVRPGDTLGTIALAYGTSAQAIVEANRNGHPRLLAHPESLRVGDELCIPTGREPYGGP